VADSVRGEARVAVAFSGGLDSSILVKCAMDCAEVVACTGYSAGAGEAERAKEAAALLGVELATTELTPHGLGAELAGLDLPFRPSLMDRGLWCLYSSVGRLAGQSGAKVMLLGQLADELFGGYAKYSEGLREGGEDAAKNMMESDLRSYPLRGRVRDVRACGRWVQARFPYEAESVVEFASQLPVSFKIKRGVRKAVLRRAGLILGLPDELAGSAKKAAQYSSGVQKLLASSRF
jgi:asparagine synthase (glutamine-hydrolysing)